MYFDFNAYEAKGGNKEHFLQHVKNSYELENDDFERLENGIKSFNEKNKTNFDLYDYLKYNANNMKFKKKENLDIKTEPEKIPEKIEPKDEDFEKYKKDYAKQGFWGDVIDDVKDDIFMVDLFSDDRKKEKDYQQRILGEVKEKISQNLDENSLDEAQKKVLKDKGLSFKDLKKRHEIANKDYKDLSDDEKKIIESENGFLNSTWNNFFNEKDANHKEFKEKYNSEGVILKSLQDKLNTINHFHKKNRLATTILNPSVSDEDNKALQKDYLNSVYEVAKFAGFDDIAQDKNGGLYLIKDDKQKGELAYKVNEGFFDNFLDSLQNSKFEIASSVAGGIKGFNSGKNPRSKVIRGIAGSALGATVGAGADYAVSSYDKDKDFKDMLDYSINSGTLDLAFGTALSTAGHFIERYGVKEALKKPFAMANKALDYTPLVSTTKNFPTQNIKAAQDLVEKSVPTQTQKELDEFYKAYGGRSDLADSKALDALVDTFKAKFGEDSFISKNTQKLNDILNLNSLSAKQNALFEAIRADESGFLLPYVKEVASYDVRAFKNLKNILNLSTAKLESSLKNLNLNKGDIKNILDELESGTKDSYNEAMNEILAKTYDDKFKVVLSRSVTPEATSSHNLDSVMTKTPSNYSTLKQNLQENYDLLDKTKPLRMARKDELNEELLKRAMEGKNKLYIANANLDLQTLGLNKNKDIKITLSSDAMRHILNKHSKDDLPVSLNDFKMIDELINNADLYALSTSKDGQKALLTGKQINGHFIAIETISTKDNELKIKTMYKSNGKLENAKAFKEAEKIAIQRIRPNTSLARSQVPLYSDAERLLSIENNQAVRSLSPKPSANLDNSHLSTLNNYTTFRKNLQEQGLLDEEAMKFLNYVESTIYNPKGVTFTQLNNALKNINSFYKQSTNPGFKEHIKNAVESFLREDIKKGINEIFKQDKNLYAKASKLYETSLAEYAQMKELLKASAYKKARNESTTQVKALDELIKYSKGQGKDGLNNLDFLRAKLDEKDVAVLEMNLLNRLYEKNLANTDESLRVFDSTSFLNELSSLQNNAFKSKEANEFIELVKGFDKLFKNDAKIALELAPVTAKKEGSALATSAKGAVLQKIVKSGFDLVFRNLGQNVLFGAFKDSIQGAALRYHLKKALQKSDTISEFNTSFKDRLKKGQFNSKTRELSKDFLNDVENFSKSLDEEINFTMQESKEMPTKTEFKIDENLQAKLNLDTDVLKADLQKLKSTHPELFENKGAVARLINKVKENPTFFFDNNRLDMKLVGAYIKDNFAELGIVTQGKNTGDIGHILETSKAQQRIKSLQNRETKSPLVETATLDTLPYNKADGRNSDISLSKDKGNSTTNVASLSKTRELSKDFLNDVENFSKSLDDEVLKDTKLSDESLKDLPKDLQEQWIKEFNLKSVDDEFIPNFKPEVKEALEKAGITEDLHLKIGSLIKLNNRQRQEFLPYIKPTIQEPNLVLDDGRGILFIKEFKGEDKSRYFMSVAKDYNGEWIFSTHTRKELKAIQNKINNSKQIYNKGFKGEEVAGTSDILKSGGTTTKPSDLQIEYPANHSSGINPKDNSTTNVASLSKTRELSKDFLNDVENFSKNLDDEVLKDTPEIRGENFTLKPDESEVKSDFNVKMSLSDNVRDLAKLKDNEIQADLHNLALKHPEMFKKPSDVFRLLKDIKENPTHFYKNNRLDASLIVKRLDDKIGKMVVKKDDGEVIHATKVDDKDLKRLEKVSKKHSDSADIIQAFTQQGSKQENQGLGYHSNSTTNLSKEQIEQGKPNIKILSKSFIKDDLLNVDEDVSIAVVSKDFIKQNLQRGKTQFRNKENLNVINDIKNNFNPREHFKPSSNFDGLPLLTKDGLVIAGNHRSTALKELNENAKKEYIAKAKEIYGDDVFKGFNENEAFIVRILENNTDENIERLSKLSNDGRLFEEAEKFHSAGAKYKEKLENIVENKSIYQINNEKDLMRYLGSNDIYEAQRALIDFLIPDANEAVKKWEKKNSGDVFFSKMLNDNAIRLLKFKQALSKNKALHDETKDFINLFARAIEGLAQEGEYKGNSDIYKILERYSLPTLDFGTDVGQKHKDLQGDILGFILRYGDTLTNPSDYLANLLQNATKFVNDNVSANIFAPDVKINNYDILETMLKEQITKSEKYQKLKAGAINIRNAENNSNLTNNNLDELRAKQRAYENEKLDDEKLNFSFNSENKHIRSLRDDLKTSLKDNLNVDFTNKQTGIKARISSDELRTMSSSKEVFKSLDNGFKREEYFEVAKNITNIFKNAKLKEKQESELKGNNIKSIYTFEKDIKINGKEAIATIKVFEKEHANNKMNFLRLQELKPAFLKPSAKSAKTADNTQSTATTHPEPANIVKSDKEHSTTNVASLSKTRELSKDFLNDVENFSKSLDDEVLKDTKLSDESLKDLPKDLQEQWIKEFNLKSVDEDFVPKLPKEIENIFEGGIHLKLGSLIKLQERDRLEFLKKIKPTLQEPDAVLRQNDGAYIFIKDFKQKKYFSTVTRNENGEWVVTSNAPKTLNNIKNKISEGGELVYNTLPELPIIAKPELPAKALNSEGDVRPNSSTNVASLSKTREFGTNYAEFYHNGKGAVAKLLERKEGQVAGAFYKEGLGDIDLVWGDLHFGLAHILERRTQDFIKEGLSEAEAKTKAKEFVEALPELIEKGEVEKIDKRAFIHFDNKKGVIALDYKGDDSRKWLLTAYKNDEASTTPANPHQSGFADKDFSTSSKSEAKDNSTTNVASLSKTRELSKDFLNDVENFSKNLDEEILKDTKASDEGLKDLPKEQSVQFNTGESKSLTELRKDIRTKLKGIKNQDIRNKNTNITAQISSTGINKISSKVAINKSIANGYSKEEHFAAGERIKELFENATLKSINEDKNKSKDIKAIYRFNTEFMINGKDTNALITAKENIVNGNKIYSLELEELSPVSFTQAHTKQEQYGQSNLTKEVADAEAKDFTTPIEKTDKPNSSTNSIKLQANAHLGTGNTKKVFDLSNKDDMQELKAFFHTHSTDTQEAKELFNRVLEQAQHFKIKVNFTNDLPRGASGEYDKHYLVKILDDYHPEYKAQTLFHELIHSVTTNAMMLVNIRTHLDKTTLLHPKQIEAVNTITTIYKDIKTKFPKFSAVKRNYGMKNEFEFIAELANPEFRDKLKKLNVFEKIVDAITKIVVYLKDSVRGYGKPTSNVYEKTKKALIDIIDNYDKDFLEKYIKTYGRDRRKDTSHYNLKLKSKFLNEKGEIDFKTLESEAVALPKALKFSAFKESILQSSNAKPQSNNKVSYKTIIGDININLGYTYSHFFKNGNGKENRFNLTGALIQILDNPLFVTKDKKGAYYFYKPFKDEKGFKHLVSISVDKNGKIEYRTSYEASNTRLKQMIKMHELAYLKE